eukprot:g6994.t2
MDAAGGAGAARLAAAGLVAGVGAGAGWGTEGMELLLVVDEHYVGDLHQPTAWGFLGVASCVGHAPVVLFSGAVRHRRAWCLGEAQAMKDHVRILVCGDERVGKSTFIGTLIAKNFAHEVPGVMSEVQIPPEENEDEVFCTITDSSALPRDRQQLVEKMQSAESILVLYDVQRPDTLTHLDTFWLPLIEANAKNVPVVIVRNKMDTLEGGLGERSVDLERQMEPLEKRYSCFHVSLECSSVTQMGINQALCHARSAALYPRAPLFDADAEELRPLFDRAMRRLFRIYDVDRDGVLSDDELNAFQLQSFDVNLSQEDHNSLRTILDRLASQEGKDVDAFVRRPSEGVPGGFTVNGFLRLIRLFIDKKQMKAPWQAMATHHYDEELVLSVPPEVSNPPPGKTAGHDQVLALPAQKFLSQLFQQFSEMKESRGASSPPTRLLTEAGQAEVFSVIPDPTCAPWDTPRSHHEEGHGVSSSSSSLGQGQEDSNYLHVPPFARLGRAPGAGRAMSMEGWMAHWQMLALHSPVLLRSHLFYVGFNGYAEDMLADKASPSHRMAASTASPRRARQASVIEVFVLGSRGCGKSSLIKALRLGDDLRSPRRASGGSVAAGPATCQERPEGMEELAPDSEEKSTSQEALSDRREGLAATTGSRSGPAVGDGAGGAGESVGEGVRGEEEGWEMVLDPEVPETCCGFARLQEATGSSGETGSGGGLSSGSSSSCGCASLSVTVTEVPESYTDSFVDDQAWRCDLALLVFDPSSRESLEFITPLLADIPPGVPRLLVSCESSREPNPSVVRTAEEKCKELELSPVIMTDPRTGEGLEGDGQLRQKIADPVCKGMLPFEERHRKANRNRRIYIAFAALAVAAGIMYAVSSTEYSAAAAAANLDGSRGGGRGALEGGALRAPVRAVKRAAAAAADYLRRWRSGRVAMLRDGEAYVGTVGSL